MPSTTRKNSNNLQELINLPVEQRLAFNRKLLQFYDMQQAPATVIKQVLDRIARLEAQLEEKQNNGNRSRKRTSLKTTK